jgi:glycerol-3-phosphate O-acyltransferase/dihydroxyacetone phosphate acyltransferase
MQALMRFAGLVMIRIFFRTITLLSRERVPLTGPVVVVSNHPNGLLDPLVARVALARPLAFLGKSTMFDNPFGRLAMHSFDAIPVYRHKDGADTSKNEETFERCRELLGRGGWLMLFPEGVSHSETTLLPLKTGAARIILSSNLPQIRVLPLGLVFDDKTTFRSRAAINVGEVIETAPFFEQAKLDDRAAVRALTERIADAVSSTMLQAPDAEFWNGLLAVAGWTHPGAKQEPDLDELTARAKQLEHAYRQLARSEPERAQALVDRARRFAYVLRSVGIENPFALERAPVLAPVRLARFAIVATLLSPLLLVGLVASWIPYQLIRVIAERTNQDEDVVSTVKAVGGLVFFPLFWIGEAVTAGILWGAALGLVALLVAPFGSWIALLVLERFAARREALGGWWMRMSQAARAESIAEQRRRLARDVDELLR